MTKTVPVTSEAPPAHCRDVGSGAPVLCLHGWGADGALFAPLAELLGDRFRLIIPDLPGFGTTAPPAAPWDVADYTQWVIALIDRLGATRVDIVAHSFGARVALMLAANHPSRVGHLVLTGAAGLRARRGVRYHLRVRIFKVVRRLSESGVMPPAMRTWARRRAANSGSRDYRAASGVMRGTFVKVVNQDLRPLMARIAAPTLLVWGDRDDEVPLRDGREMEAGIRDSGLVIFEGRGHYAYIEEGARFAHIVAVFLADPVHQ